MNKIWLQIFATMIVGSILKSALHNSLVWVAIDLGILGISYLILRQHLNVNLKGSMLFLSGLTVISILADLNLMSGMVSNLLVLGLVGWMMFGKGGQSNGSRNPKSPTIRHKWHK